ncbi:unnamed protein product [Clonostachys chloroleuca]|uniref:Uncharacterized protein n=1 Tax=Clonostachys chloroleuca TaxID=1926264 RepID=A0AA35LPZ0_9HYPO|nr:unnamed protein product [Clonostachys chloroleuca]
MSTPSSEYRAEGSPLLQAGVRCYNAPGQLGLDDEGIPFKDARQQLHAAFLNVEKNLIAAGAKNGWKNVYKCVAYHSPDLSEERLGIYAGLIREFCGANRPSQTSVTVPELWQGAYIEITVEGIIPA